MSEVLKLQNVCKSFGKRMVVQDISFTVEAGQIFGFLGPNGAGKTTTIKMILGLLTPDSGSIQVMGHDIEQDFEAAMHSISGIVENPDMYPYLSGYENLRLHARACGVDEKRIGEVVQMVGMAAPHPGKVQIVFPRHETAARRGAGAAAQPENYDSRRTD